MPEGDTIHRSARTLHAAMAGQVLIGVETTDARLRSVRPERLVGQTVEEVEARGKHLLHWFAPSGVALHTHMRMTGSWHTYRPGSRWRKPARFARLVLRTEQVEAVAFSVPVIELLTPKMVQAHPSLARLGPDPLAGGADEPVDLEEAQRRLGALSARPIGVALLDQRVLAGVGNVYRNEVLFIHRVNPWTPVDQVPPDTRAQLLATAAALLQANVAHGGHGRITTRPPDDVARAEGASSRRNALWVYGKAGQPCPRCGSLIRSRAQGDHARITYWCPGCQAAAV